MPWSPDRLAVTYDERLLDWKLGQGHPTYPVRATLAIDLLKKAGVAMDVAPITWQLTDELQLVHTSSYVTTVLTQGLSSEWSGPRRDLGAVAAHMFAGTVQLVHGVLNGSVLTGFSPQGAKHHAMADRGAGFCVFNDIAWAAQHLAGLGKKVLYVDLDAHHGDGVEALTRDNPRITTVSVHDSTIFPGTGHHDDPARSVYNYALAGGAGDAELQVAVKEISERIHDDRPDVVLVAVGADGHVTDPLSSLQYTLGGYRDAGQVLGVAAAAVGAPAVMGGAGGYQPTTLTPACWSTFVHAFDAAYRST